MQFRLDDQSDPRSQSIVPPLSVTKVVELINLVFQDTIPVISFQGEISQVTRASSGHLYFTVKDDTSQLPAVMWRSTAGQLGFAPRQGLAVVCVGKPNVYGGNGRFQIVVHRMTLAGEGALRQKFLELKKKLEEAGFFAPERKRPLPRFPLSVGLVTSKSGAALHDIMVKIRERMPSTKVLLADTRVQGEGAALEIAAAIDLLSQSGLVEVIIVGRGGGSLEDLWAFNEEAVVQAIFRSRVPVVSGVGHEVDITLADLAADLRAPTPTAAAQIVVPARADLLLELSHYLRRLDSVSRVFENSWQELDGLDFRLNRSAQQVLQRAQLQYANVATGLKLIHPAAILEQFDSQLAMHFERLLSSLQRNIAALKNDIGELATRLVSVSPSTQVEQAYGVLLHCWQSLEQASASQMATRAARVAQLEARLRALNPHQVLERGFSIARHNGRILSDVSSLEIGAEVQVSLARGSFGANVTAIKESKD